MIKNIRLVIVDDHEMVVQGLSALLNQYTGIEVVRTFNSGYDLLSAYPDLQADLVLMDINMPTINGFETSAELLKIDPLARVILISMEVNTPYLNKAMEEGIKGYVSKSADIDDLVESIKKVYMGNTAFINHMEVSRS